MLVLLLLCSAVGRIRLTASVLAWRWSSLHLRKPRFQENILCHRRFAPADDSWCTQCARGGLPIARWGLHLGIGLSNKPLSIYDDDDEFLALIEDRYEYHLGGFWRYDERWLFGAQLMTVLNQDRDGSNDGVSASLQNLDSVGGRFESLCEVSFGLTKLNLTTLSQWAASLEHSRHIERQLHGGLRLWSSSRIADWSYSLRALPALHEELGLP